MISTVDIDRLIIGRIDPHIYAFSTNTVPNYLKVGDTYRPVNVRLDEWRTIFPSLEHDDNWEWTAKTQNGKYFRDFAVHYYLEQIKHFHRLQPGDIPNLPYYSKEFFQNASPKDIDEAILDIERCAAIIESTRYQFYSEERLPIESHFERTEDYPLRPNQEEAVEAFKQARKSGRKNLLMYAVMRFGKSFTSMYCAAEMKAKVVLIVSAKADVRTEWQKTVESHKHFSKYDFLDSAALLADKRAIAKRLESNKSVAIFLTLQDMMGGDIKSKHKELFKQNIDLLIVDETHFGARASEYGRILRDSQLTDAQARRQLKLSGECSFDDLDAGLEQIKKLHVDTTLHLSGTPYRILMGNEFKREDIIAFCQFTDIIDAKEKWDRDNLSDENTNEWENPYYGFPQMIRFAFNPNTSAQQLIKSLLEQGKSTALNELFRPHSIAFDPSDNGHTRFVHEPEVLELMRAIDGSAEDENILSFLDYDKLKEGKMCRHMVFVLPFCASCDAMQALLQTHRTEFKNLQDYTIVNIAGVTNQFGSTDEIKQRITELEQQGKKSITLTVNRMLTGSTVREWDTMLFLKDVSSPQEYDQAIFRLQNQYVTTYRDEEGASIKYDMKPQTLLVDFDPNRMFRMQEQKSKIYNVNTNERGNEELETRIQRELQVSPIIVVNKDRLVQVTPTNIMDAVREYSATRTVMEEASAIPVDMDIVQDPGLWDDIKDINPINASKGIAVKPVEGGGEDYDEPIGNIASGASSAGDSDRATRQEDTEQRDKKLATLFALILFYALLTDNEVSSLRDVIESIRDDLDNQRILRNLGVRFHTLIYLRSNLNPFVLSDLDYKIQTSNQLLNDTTFSPQERVERALQKFGRMSESEIVTPSHVADQMVALLPEMNESDHLLDIASKQGEFACALYRRFGDKIRNNVYSVPTSSLAYEFTRKVYRLLGMPVQNVYSTFNAYDLINDNNESYINTLTNMNFSAVVGNPPYQESDGGAGASSVPVYDKFFETAKLLHPSVISMIMPSRWMTGGRGLDDFRRTMMGDTHIKELHDFYDAGACFTNVEIKGGVCYLLWNKNHDGKCDFSTMSVTGEVQRSTRYLQEEGSDIVIRDGQLIKLKNIAARKNEATFDTIVSSMKPYGLRGDFFKNQAKYGLPAIRKTKRDGDITIIGLDEKLHRVRRYVPQSYPLPQRNLLEDIKLFIPRNYGSGRMGDMPSTLEYAMPFDACTETFIQIGPFKSLEEAQNCEIYMRTKFFTVLVGIRKQDQGAGKGVYQYVPLQDFSIKWTDEMLYEKYGIDKDMQEYIDKILR